MATGSFSHCSEKLCLLYIWQKLAAYFAPAHDHNLVNWIRKKKIFTSFVNGNPENLIQNKLSRAFSISGLLEEYFRQKDSIMDSVSNVHKKLYFRHFWYSDKRWSSLIELTPPSNSWRDKSVFDVRKQFYHKTQQVSSSWKNIDNLKALHKEMF